MGGTGTGDRGQGRTHSFVDFLALLVAQLQEVALLLLLLGYPLSLQPLRFALMLAEVRVAYASASASAGAAEPRPEAESRRRAVSRAACSAARAGSTPG